MFTNQSDYARAIDLLMGGSLDYKAITIALAKAYPSILVELNTSLQPKAPTWKDECVDFMLKEEKVNAIKCLRTNANLGLKEAKDVIDNLQNKMYRDGQYYKPYDCDDVGFTYRAGPLHESQMRIFLDLCAIVETIRNKRGY